MKILGESNCLVIGHLTGDEIISFFRTCGTAWWNDTENIICVNLQECNYEEKYKYRKFFELDEVALNKTEFLIVLLNK